MLAAGLLGLIVNLECMGRLRLSGESRIIVLVDSQREAALLRLLNLAAMIPRCGVRVIRRVDELHEFAGNSPSEKMVMVATSRLYSKHYQVMVDLRRHLRLIVL